MTHFPRNDTTRRAPRVQLNGSVPAAIHADGGQHARAKLQSISITGGLLQLQKELCTGDCVEIAFPTRSGPVYGMAEMLEPMPKAQNACLQPFRFIALGDGDHNKLSLALDTILDRSLILSATEPSQTEL